MGNFMDFINEEKLKTNKGVYIALKVSERSTLDIQNYIKENLDILNISGEIVEDLHCTLIFSERPALPHGVEVNLKSYNISVISTHFSIFGDSLVLELKSPELIERQEQLVKEYSFTSNFSEYKPHISIAYGVDANLPVHSLPKVTFALELEQEYMEDLNIKDTDGSKNALNNGKETLFGKEMGKENKGNK